MAENENAPDPSELPSATYRTEDPIDSLASVSGVGGHACLFVSKAGPDFFTGLPSRFIRIESKAGVLMSATISLADLTFIVNGLAKMVEEDLFALSKLDKYRMFMSERSRALFNSSLTSASASLEKCKELAVGVNHWYPEDEESPEETSTD